MPGTEATAGRAAQSREIRLARPTQGLQMAYDPRIPADHQIFSFQMEGLPTTCDDTCAVTWVLNGTTIGVTQGGQYNWKVQKGKFQLKAEARRGENLLFRSGTIHFLVK
jgi:penicillin-binding protein 1C